MQGSKVISKGKVVPIGKENWIFCPVCESIIGKHNVKEVDEKLYDLHCDMCLGIIRVPEEYVRGKL